jgi:hypothetical protein
VSSAVTRFRSDHWDASGPVPTAASSTPRATARTEPLAVGGPVHSIMYDEPAHNLARNGLVIAGRT